MANNRLTELLLANTDKKWLDVSKEESLSEINRFFKSIDSGANEQITYFPFDGSNPIYKAYKIKPTVNLVKTNKAETMTRIMILASLWSDNKPLLDTSIHFTLGDDKIFSINILKMSNVQDKNNTKRQGNIAPLFINSLQNTLAYSAKPGQISGLCEDNGAYYMAKWFDFDQDKYDFSLWLPMYKKKFVKSVLSYGFGVNETELNSAVKDIKTPIDFRLINKALKLPNDNIGRLGMYSALYWSGACGLPEMLETNHIRQLGQKMLVERGVKTFYPSDFQQIISDKMREKVR